MGWEGWYEVSSLGAVRRVRPGKGARCRVLRAALSKRGYMVVALCRHGKPELKTVHRLVAMAFISNPENKREVNHLNHDRTDNCVANLEWTTPTENQRHSWIGNRRRPGNRWLKRHAA